MRLLVLVVLFLGISSAIECNPMSDCKTCRQCDRNMVECWKNAEAKPDLEQQVTEKCKCFWIYYECVERVGCLYFPQAQGWWEGFDSNSTCPEYGEKPERIGDVPTDISFSIFDAGDQLNPVCDDGGVFDETVPLGVCLENDEYGAYRLDVVDGFVSKGGDTNEQTPGLKIQYHFGCTKDENGECSECGHVGEVWPDMCAWGCQVKSPESGCHSFWGSGFDKELNPYSSVSLNITVTTNKPCDDDVLDNYVDRLLSEGYRKASLNSEVEVRDWECRDIPVAEPPAAKKRQDEPAATQITDLWVEMVFTGEDPRVGAEKVRAAYTTNAQNSELVTFGTREGVTVVPKSVEINIYEESDTGLSGAAIFGIVVLVLVILVIIGVGAFFALNSQKSSEFA